jgi:cytochrome c-type biogenesis protein CcmE
MPSPTRFLVVCRVVLVILLEIGITLYCVDFMIQIFYFEKIRVFKAGFCYEYISME